VSVALSLLGATLAAAWFGVLVQALRTDRVLARLADVPPDAQAPSVSVVVPCRNEARGVVAAVRSLLAQDLPALEVVAVDDRSEVATGGLLEALAAEDPRLAVVHVAALPAGWLGKNHALQVGGERARGEWLLFTDGDVVFAPDALRRALAFAGRHGLGHVAAAPRFVAPGFLERAFVSAFACFASLAFRVTDLPRPGTRGFIGVGAFNLVRREAWQRVGGHRRLALEVVDDVKLGLVLRRSGVPQGAVSADQHVAVRWQHGLVPSVLGLVKNAFAACEFRLDLAAGAAGVVVALGAGPLAVALLALAGGHRAAAALAGLAVLLAAAIHGGTARRVAGGSGAEGVLWPLAALLLAGVIAGSVALAFWRGAVVWRGTSYPLEVLRRGVVRQGDWPVSGAAGWPRR
jgi:hypothetical protein